MNEALKAPALRSLDLPGGQRLTLFGVRLPALPDFLADHTLLGASDAEKLNETLERFGRLLIGLRKYPNSAYALRYLSAPEMGAVQVFVLGRVLDAPDRVQARASLAAADLRRHLLAYGLDSEPLQAEELEAARSPFGALPLALVELRPEEEIVQLRPRGQAEPGYEAYLPHPYHQPQGAFLEPFENLLSQPTPVAISVLLEPTSVTPEEFSALEQAAQLGQTYADLTMTPQSQTGVARWKDPNSELAGRIYAAYRQSLAEPFLTVTQVASPDPNAAWNVARALASAAAHTLGQEIHVQPVLHKAVKAEEAQAARFGFESLTLQVWGRQIASPGKQRLPYLMGAKAASVLFRFPVSVRGGVPGIAVRQIAPDFEPGPRPERIPPGEVQIGALQRGGLISSPLKDFTRHALITGFTGSGKTNTVLFLLNQLWAQHKTPFLVIESAKKEYRALLKVPGFSELLVFTFGDESTSPFRFNPFALLPGVRVEAHLGRLQACFDAALPQFGILPSLVAETMEDVYRQKGWKLTDRHDNPQDERLFPTMRDMFRTIVRAVEGRGYSGEMRDNLRAATSGRIGSLLRGSRGRMFDCQKSYPAELLFNRPVIFELNDLNEDDKALTMMFLLMGLREYRELHPDASRLQHLTVVEEAHNVVSNVVSVGSSEVSADTKAKAVAAFSNMLAEVRSYGEGILISDQSPEKLAPDAMRNTNLQIAHQLRDQRDREAMARAMTMDEQQQNYLGKLRTGQAAFFRTGMEKATFISVPEFKDSAGFNALPTDAEVRQRMEPFRRQHHANSLPFDGCRFCGSPCQYREAIEPYTLEKQRFQQFKAALARFDTETDIRVCWQGVVQLCLQAAADADLPASHDAAYCYFAHEIDFPVTEAMRNIFVEIAQKEIP
ncbi:MAG: hypothetical protein Fur0035_06760 [Anaerolineales bacterium]